MKYKPTCSCGWTAPANASESLAWQLAEDHAWSRGAGHSVGVKTSGKVRA